MPRRARTLIANMPYHIISRGNQQQRIFFDDEDFQRFIDLIGKYKKKFDAKVYAYCLMYNHIHLVIDLLNKLNLWKVMHGVNMSYAKYFNHKYNKCGHLLQDRYKSYVISKDSYVINCVNYIEYNPVRAGIVDKPEDYPWSSYRARVLGVKGEILDTLVF